MDVYSGREQTRAKHAILGRYLERLALITLGQFKTLDFIDAFAGPWESKDTELSDTSIGISLATLQRVAEQRGLAEGDLCCIFNEKDPEAFARLKSFEQIAAQRYPLVRMHTFSGPFVENAHAIRAASNNKFRLLFVDPTGFTGFPPSAMELFKGRPSEVIINFMESFILRFPTKPRSEQLAWLTELVGADRAKALEGRDIPIDELRDAYLKMVKQQLGYHYAASSPVHFADKNAVQFHLIFGTHHPKGMEVMRQAEFEALSEHDKDRFKRRADKSKQMNLFEPEEELGPYTLRRMEHAEVAAEELLAEVISKPGDTFSNCRARVQEKLYLRDTEVAAAAVELANAGKIDPSWLARGSRVKRPNQTDEMWPFGNLPDGYQSEVL